MVTLLRRRKEIKILRNVRNKKAGLTCTGEGP